MTDDRVRAYATDYVLQRYHLADLAEAQQKLTPTQYGGVLREIDTVEAQITAQFSGSTPDVAATGRRTRSVSTPIGSITPVTGLLLLAIWLVFIWESLQPGGSTNGDVLKSLGAVDAATISSGQYWRLVAACFLHAGLFHIFSNSIALLWLGSLAERFYGPLRFLGIYLAAGIGGSIAAVLTATADQGPTVGASGAIMGMVGAMLAGAYRNRGIIGAATSRQLFNGLVVLLVVNLAFGFTNPGISNAGHLGGAATGAVLALLIPFNSPRYGRAYARIANIASIVLVLITIALAATYVTAH